VIADLVGKAAHIRTVPVPDWVKSAADAWTSSAPVTEGRLFQCVSRKGSVGRRHYREGHLARGEGIGSGGGDCEVTQKLTEALVGVRRWNLRARRRCTKPLLPDGLERRFAFF
jgi:hypothetical protein